MKLSDDGLSVSEQWQNQVNDISMTNVSLGSAQLRAHMMIDQGVLYLRRGSALIAYKIKED